MGKIKVFVTGSRLSFCGEKIKEDGTVILEDHHIINCKTAGYAYEEVKEEKDAEAKEG